MFENKFDRTLEEVSVVHDLDWDGDSKVFLLARFLGTHQELFGEFEKFLEQQADEELREFEGDKGEPGKLKKYHATGTCEDGPFAIDVEGINPADAFVEVALSVRGDTKVDTLTDESGVDVIDQIDPNDPIL